MFHKTSSKADISISGPPYNKRGIISWGHRWMPSRPFLWYDGFPTCLHAKIFKKIFHSSKWTDLGKNFHKFIKKYAKLEKNWFKWFYFTTLCQKNETGGKMSFIKVVVAAFLIKNIIFLNLKRYFSLQEEFFLIVWHVATWQQEIPTKSWKSSETKDVYATTVLLQSEAK